MGDRGPAIRWCWDHPEPNGVVRGRTLIVDGWIADWDGAIGVLADGRVLGRTTARYARPDVAAALALADDMVGFHLEVALPADAGSRFTAAVGVEERGRWLRVLSERFFLIVDSEPLPYEEAFHGAEQRDVVLHRQHVYGSGPPSAEPSPPMIARRCARERVLDLGCGAGAYADALRAEGRTVHGVEYDRTTAATARGRGISVARADARHLPFRKGSFDSVLAVEVFEHVADVEAALCECARVARVNIVLSVPNASVIPHLYPAGVVPWHLLEGDPRELLQCRESGAAAPARLPSRRRGLLRARLPLHRHAAALRASLRGGRA